jgi:D-methionine transport system ATP-binding protein
MSKNYIIDIKKLNKSFSERKVLRDIDLSVVESSITGFIGRSGAGKTTLLRLINLLERPDSGSITVNGYDMLASDQRLLRALRKQIGMIFQSFNLLTTRNVYANIALPLELLAFSKKDISKKVHEITKLVGLEDHLFRYPGELSGGQKQRVAIARSLVSEAKILLCDEFTSALDPTTIFEILSLLREINLKLGVTVILISHDMSVIREICDYVYVMAEGRIVESGSVREIFYLTKHEVTKSLIKAMFACEVPNSLKLRQTTTFSEFSEVMLRLIFSDNNVQEPFISELVMEFNIAVNIISGHYDHFRDSALGHLLITFKYNDDLYRRIEIFMKKYGVHYEFLGYLRSKA